MDGIILAPDEPIDVTVRLGRTHVLASSPTRVQVLIETRPNARTCHVVPCAEIRFVIDVSGSMGEATKPGAPSKLEIVKTALFKLLAQMTAFDTVLLSVFSNDGRLVVPRTHLTPEARSRIQIAIEALQPETTTTISAGLELALDLQSAMDALPRVILFTDGQSSSSDMDHSLLVKQADRARAQNIPLSIYGTGSDYNWSLLQQVAIRAGGGSFCKHVLDVAGLEGHMLAELAYLRGTAIDRFEIDGIAINGVTIISVMSMMPQIREIEIVNQRVFRDHAGALDLHRGAQYLVELEIDDTSQGTMTVLFLTLRGRIRTSGKNYERTIEVPVTFVADANEQSPVDEQVHRVLLMLSASRKAEEGSFADAARLYRRAGDPATATAMDNLLTASLHPGADPVDLIRTATSMGLGSLSETYTIDHSRKGG